MEATSGLYQLTVSKDGMAVLLDCPIEPPDSELLAQDIERGLEALSIANIPEKQWITQWLEKAFESTGAPLKDVVLIRGRPPGKAVYGRVEWAGDFFNTGFVIDKNTGTINYRKRSAQSSVTEGQLLGRRIPYRDGDDGCNVFGKTVPGEKAKVFYPSVGMNVTLDESTNSYISQKNGRIRLLNDTLFVDEIYVIEGSIGIETGDLIHTGAVIVKEDILEGSTVEAEGDIEVFGVIEAAHVKTNGNLIVRGGILRAKETKIKAAGSIQAQFIIDSNVEAGRDILIEKEVLNANIRTFGALIVPRGRIVGGQVAALRGINAGQVNTPASVPTELIVGENEILLNTLHKLKSRIEEIDAKLMKRHTIMFQQMHHGPEKSSQRNETIKKLQEEIRQEEKNREVLKSQLEKTWGRI
ncbi:MAG: FapA family protein, partial [Planctomycetes bacterium]|nr:FapA family protein [Planctomycetota bacterium]